MAKWSDTVGSGLAGLGRFLDKDARHALSDVPVRLLSIHDDPTNRFGARWVLSLAYLDTGEKVALGIKRNVVRDSILEVAKASLAAGETFDPVVIRYIESKAGNPTIAILDAPTEMLDRVVAETGADSLADLMGLVPWSPDDDSDDTSDPPVDDTDAPDDGADTGAPEATAIPGERLSKKAKG